MWTSRADEAVDGPSGGGRTDRRAKVINAEGNSSRGQTPAAAQIMTPYPMAMQMRTSSTAESPQREFHHHSSLPLELLAPS